MITYSRHAGFLDCFLFHYQLLGTALFFWNKQNQTTICLIRFRVDSLTAGSTRNKLKIKTQFLLAIFLILKCMCYHIYEAWVATVDFDERKVNCTDSSQYYEKETSKCSSASAEKCKTVIFVVVIVELDSQQGREGGVYLI